MNNSIFKIEKRAKIPHNIFSEKSLLLKKNISILSSLNNNNNFIPSNQIKNFYNSRITTQSFKMLNENEQNNLRNNNQKTNGSYFNCFMNNKNEFDIFQSKENIYHFTNDSFSVNFLTNNKNTQSLFQDNNIALEENNYLNNVNYILNQENQFQNNNEELNKKEIKETIKNYCEHINCEQTFKTLKQKLNHHKKMEPKCRSDTINLIKSISELKKIILYLKTKNSVKVPISLIKKYEKILSSIPHREYAHLLSGLNFFSDVNSKI